MFYYLAAMTCKSDEFLCANNHSCIPKHKMCDGVNDCGDYSDESQQCGECKNLKIDSWFLKWCQGMFNK